MSLSHSARLLLLMVVTWGVPAFAASLQSAVADAPSSVAVAMSATGSTPLRLTGTLQTYDASAQFVAVTTASGRVRLSVTPESRIRQGRHTVDASTLRTRIGSTVVVRYVESERGRVVVSLTLSGRAGDAPH